MSYRRLFNKTTSLYASALVGLCLYALPASAGQAQTSQGLRVTEVSESTHPFTTWHCSRRPLRVRMLGQLMEIKLEGESRILHPAIAASGARYVAPNDSGTEFWSKGSQATVTWSGSELPVCVEVGALMVPMRASGNEPFWAVEYNRWSVTFTEPGQAPKNFDVEGQERQGDGWQVHATSGRTNLYLDVEPKVCEDNMTGLPHPYAVTLKINGQAMHGCGGNPERMLQGVRWQLKAIDGKNVTSQATLEFLANNRLAGSNGCNRLMGSYELSGEGLRFSELASTRMACEPAVMSQADVIDQYLSGARGFTFDARGALVLKTDKGKLLFHSSDSAGKSTP